MAIGIDQWRLALFDADPVSASQKVKTLSTRSSTLDYRFDIGITPLVSACVGNNPDVVKLILEAGASVDYADDQGWTALHWCAQGGRDACAEILLGHGANPNSSSCEEGSTPLHFSANCGTAGIARILTTHGADPFSREAPSNRTPIQAGAGRPTWLEALEIAPLTPGDCDSNAMSALGWAVKGADTDQSALLACRFWAERGSSPAVELSPSHPETMAARNGYAQTAAYLRTLRERDGLIEIVPARLSADPSSSKSL
jgi:hypothetical protein